jgi:flagellar basal-body rod protein FlgB
MLDSMFETTSIPVLEQAMRFAQSRHNVLAGNIANLDTPGYKSQDLSPEKFAERLKAAIAARDQFTSVPRDPVLPGESIEPSGEKPTLAAVNPLSDVTAGLDDILYHDESTGSLEKQVAAIAKNQMQHNLAVSVLSSQFRLLQAAISERV